MGRPTPNTDPSNTYVCRRVRFPAIYRQSVAGALSYLFQSNTWEQVGDVPIDDAVTDMWDMYYDYLESDCLYIGAIVFYATSNAPNGILPFDDGVYNRVDYPLLYDAIAPMFITDADHFQLHNWYGRAIVAAGAGAGLTPRAIGDTFGAETHQLSVAEMPSHDHNHHEHGVDLDLEQPVAVPQPVTGYAFPGLTGSRGGNQPHENIQPSISFPVGIVAK